MSPSPRLLSRSDLLLWLQRSLWLASSQAVEPQLRVEDLQDGALLLALFTRAFPAFFDPEVIVTQPQLQQDVYQNFDNLRECIVAAGLSDALLPLPNEVPTEQDCLKLLMFSYYHCHARIAIAEAEELRGRLLSVSPPPSLVVGAAQCGDNDDIDGDGYEGVVISVARNSQSPPFTPSSQPINTQPPPSISFPNFALPSPIRIVPPSPCVDAMEGESTPPIRRGDSEYDASGSEREGSNSNKASLLPRLAVDSTGARRSSRGYTLDGALHEEDTHTSPTPDNTRSQRKVDGGGGESVDSGYEASVSHVSRHRPGLGRMAPTTMDPQLIPPRPGLPPVAAIHRSNHTRRRQTYDSNDLSLNISSDSDDVETSFVTHDAASSPSDGDTLRRYDSVTSVGSVETSPLARALQRMETVGNDADDVVRRAAIVQHVIEASLPPPLSSPHLEAFDDGDSVIDESTHPMETIDDKEEKDDASSSSLLSPSSSSDSLPSPDHRHAKERKKRAERPRPLTASTTPTAVVREDCVSHSDDGSESRPTSSLSSRSSSHERTMDEDNLDSLNYTPASSCKVGSRQVSFDTTQNSDSVCALSQDHRQPKTTELGMPERSTRELGDFRLTEQLPENVDDVSLPSLVFDIKFSEVSEEVQRKKYELFLKRLNSRTSKRHSKKELKHSNKDAVTECVIMDRRSTMQGKPFSHRVSQPFNQPLSQTSPPSHSHRFNWRCNSILIINALKYRLLVGSHQLQELRSILSILQPSAQGKQTGYVILLSSRYSQTFRGLYAAQCCHDTEQVILHRQMGRGPSQITSPMIEEYYRYDSGSKVFQTLTTPSLYTPCDAVVLFDDHRFTSKAK